MVVKAFHQFFCESSNFKQFEEPISELPTFVICTSGTVWNYEIEFGISFDVDGDFHTDFDNHGFEANTQKIYSYFSGICYQISFLKTEEEIRKETLTSIDLFFNKSISFEELPDLNFYVTSEKNANGIVFNDWMDGEEFTFKIDKVIIFISNFLCAINIIFKSQHTFLVVLKTGSSHLYCLKIFQSVQMT